MQCSPAPRPFLGPDPHGLGLGAWDTKQLDDVVRVVHGIDSPSIFRPYPFSSLAPQFSFSQNTPHPPRSFSSRPPLPLSLSLSLYESPLFLSLRVSGARVCAIVETMRGEDQQSRLIYELCALLLTILRPPSHPPATRTGRRAVAPARVTPAGFASLLLGASLALMLCGSVTFVIGFILMPWVIGLVMVFYFVGVVSSLSGLGGRSFALIPPPPEGDLRSSLFQTSNYLDVKWYLPTK
uniref:Uncharacterized protein n=1 Tax=Ananas comosus var. bracteatus TaxID=296719 RepID=A0A6V7QUJ6_ANACO